MTGRVRLEEQRPMLSRRRLPFLVAFPALYVAIAVVRASDPRPAAWLLVMLALGVALVGGRVPDGWTTENARRRLWVTTGLSVAIATAALATRAPWAALARELAAWLAMTAAVRAVTTIDGEVGLAAKASEATAGSLSQPVIARGAAAALAVVWAPAVILDLVAVFRGPGGGATALVVSTVCAVLALVVLGAAALTVARVRRLELALTPRAHACAGACGAGLLVAGAFAFGGVADVDAAVALGGAIASALVVRLARTENALLLAQRGRRALTLLIFGGPVAALAAIAVEGRMSSAGGVALVLALVALLVGAISSKLEEPLLPVKGIMLEALADARSAAREREAREAMAYALVRIREACATGLGPTAAPSPELWLLHPLRVLTVNAAGYLQERNAELPEGIFDVALGEPHATLRTAVLRALEVRRPDLRPILAWLEHRDALFATVIAEQKEPDGLLVVPAGAREEPLTLEEARAAKVLADAFVAVSQATSARVRHLARERELKDRIDDLDDETARLKHALDLDASRNVLASTRLARPATVGIYAASSRMAYEALERRVAQEAPVVVVARAGIDPVPYVARAHLAGPRKSGPFVVVDGTSSREHDLERWQSERTSPLALADRGLLFLVDGAALPRDVQVLLARAVAERRPPWERATALDFAIALSATKAPAELVEAGRLAPELAARFEATEAIRLPGLAERPEDLRSIVADRLAREGLRVTGKPVGIDAGAYARLVEHPFDGEDAELASLVTRLVAHVADQGSEVVRASDVDAVWAEPPTPEDRASRRSPWGSRSGS